MQSTTKQISSSVFFVMSQGQTTCLVGVYNVYNVMNNYCCKSYLLHLISSNDNLLRWIPSTAFFSILVKFYLRQKSPCQPIMALIFEVSKKEHLEKEDYWQNIGKSLGLEHRLQNELNDKERTAEYDSRVYKGLVDQIQKAIAAYDPLDGDDASTGTKALVKVVDMPFGKRPLGMEIDPAQGGREIIVNAVTGRVRAKFLHQLGLGDLLAPPVGDN